MVKRKRPPNEETKMCVQFVFKIRNNKSFSSRHRPKILNNKRNKKPKIRLQDNKEKSRNIIGLKERILQTKTTLHLNPQGAEVSRTTANFLILHGELAPTEEEIKISKLWIETTIWYCLSTANLDNFAGRIIESK